MSKKITLRLNQVLNSIKGFSKLTQEDLPVKTAYRLKRIVDTVSSEAKYIEQSRVKLVKKYAEPAKKDKDGKEVQEDIKVTKRLPEFQKEFNELLSEEVEINSFTIPFKDIEDCKLSVQDIVAIEPWVEGIPAELTEDIKQEKPVKEKVEEKIEEKKETKEEPKTEGKE